MNKFVGPLSVGDNGDSDVEALQTDVMRFLSIIALCLLAVFAAVSSEPPPAVKEMIKVQEAAIAALEQTLESATEKYHEKLNKLETENDQLKLATAVAVKPVLQEPLKEQLQSLEKQRDAMREEIGVMSTALEQSESHNRKLESLLDVQQQSTVQQSMPMAEEPPDDSQSVQVETDSVEPVAVEPEEENGFTLAFESDDVLLELVKRGRVSLFAKSANQVWQLKVAENRFTQVAQVPEFFELGSVPKEMQQQAQRQLESLTIEWGVSFDKVLRVALDALFAEQTGGDIIVQKNGGLAIVNPE